MNALDTVNRIIADTVGPLAQRTAWRTSNTGSRPGPTTR